MEEMELNKNDLAFFKSILEIDDDDFIDYIINIDIDLEDRFLKLNLLVPLRIDYDNIEHDLENISMIYAFWTSLYSKLKSIVSQREILLKHARAKAAIVFKKKLNLSRKTDIDYYVDSLDYIKTKELELSKIRESMDVFKNFIKSIEMKFEALRSLAGFKRLEFNKS